MNKGTVLLLLILSLELHEIHGKSIEEEEDLLITKLILQNIHEKKFKEEIESYNLITSPSDQNMEVMGIMQIQVN